MPLYQNEIFIIKYFNYDDTIKIMKRPERTIFVHPNDELLCFEKNYLEFTDARMHTSFKDIPEHLLRMKNYILW